MQVKLKPALQNAYEVQLSTSPRHEKFLNRRLLSASAVELDFLEYVAGLIKRLFPSDLDTLAADYDWLCEQQIEEELYFRRNKSYRLKSFQEAFDEVYSNELYMKRYMNGLLMSQLWWSNHTSVMQYYANNFLPSLKPKARILEIGPGHGLLSYMAAENKNCKEIECWDISPASVELTRSALKKLSAENKITIRTRDLFKSPPGEFDAVLFCEILEHMEYPLEALKKLRSQLGPSGSVYINMPINSPAPDHLFNKSTPEELYEFVESAGLKVVDFAYFPATNYSLDRAREKKLTINCVFVAQKKSLI